MQKAGEDTMKTFCTRCGILLSRGHGTIFNLIAEKVYGDKPATDEPPVEFSDGIYCAYCAKKRRNESLSRINVEDKEK